MLVAAKEDTFRNADAEVKLLWQHGLMTHILHYVPLRHGIVR